MFHKFVDIHSHILPGVDDGSPNMDVSMEMLNIAYSEGIRHLFLTPHYIRGENQYKPGDLKEIFEALQKKSLQEFPRLHLHLGNEVYYTPGISEDIRENRIYTMRGTRYVLVEFAVTATCKEINQAMKELTRMRLFPIIAHVERYRNLVRKPELLRELREMGVYFQLNADGVLGSRFDANTRWRRELIEDEWITFLGTDAHDLKHRAPLIQKAGAWMSARISVEYQKDLFWANARSLVRNEYI